MADLTGQQFGSYRLVRLLGTGGFASVYLGQHIRIASKQAAIKILNLRDVNMEQFRQEAETTERLVHPNIVRLFDFDIQEGTAFLVLDYAPGGSLRTRHPQGSQIPLSTVIWYLKEIVPALQHAHDQHILHRDIKPDNILIGRQGELLLSDFGIALLSQTGKTSSQDTTNIGGTPSYMAPEQFRGKPEMASDQYSLATMVYEWLSGSTPFQGGFIQLGYQHTHEVVPPLRGSVPLLPTTVEQVVAQALAKQPAARFPSVQAFAQALDAANQQYTTFLQDPISLEAREDILDHSADEVAQERSTLLATPNIDQPGSTETPAPFTFLSRVEASTEDPMPLTSPTLRPAPKSRKCVLLILASVLLITLVGGSTLYYLYFPISLSIHQDTGNSTPTHTLSPANVSRLMPLWNFATAYAIRSTPVVASGMVYIGSGDNKLYVFDATCKSSCQPLWFWSFTAGDGVNSSPVVAGGMVYLGSEDNSLYAFDATCRSACKPLWSFATEGGIVSSPIVAGGMVYVGSGDSKLYAFGAACRSVCKPLWTYTTGDKITSSPVIAGRMVYVGSEDSKLYAFDATCRSVCQPLWSFTTGSKVTSSPVVTDSMVYIGSEDKRLYAFDAACRSSCKPLWSFATQGSIDSSPVVAAEMVYIGSEDSKLYAFDAACRSACQPLWSFASRGKITSSPVIAAGSVYVGSEDSKLYAFDATCRSDCRPLWSFATGGSIDSSAAIAGGMIYIGSDDNEIYAFGLAT